MLPQKIKDVCACEVIVYVYFCVYGYLDFGDVKTNTSHIILHSDMKLQKHFTCCDPKRKKWFSLESRTTSDAF